MTAEISRRTLLAAAPAATVAATGLAGLLPRRAVAEAGAAAAAAAVHPGFPSQEPSQVREMVGVSHGNLARVKELVAARPELAKAAWDWGFGDWETALGAASHVGNREIAELLIAHGARPDVFTAAMLGNLPAVQALVAATPGLQRQHGPHGITLLAHARAGGEPAAAVVAWLEELGGADERYTNLPLSAEEQQAYVGTYRFGDGAEDRFEVLVDRRGALAIERAGGAPRVLFHQGADRFHPAGAPSAAIRFDRREGRIAGLVIENPEPVVTALRLAAG